MRKVSVEEKVVQVKVIDDILCNECGNSLRGRADNFHGLIEAEVLGGYGSDLGDQESYKFSICEECLRKMFARFITPSTGSTQISWTKCMRGLSTRQRSP